MEDGGLDRQTLRIGFWVLAGLVAAMPFLCGAAARVYRMIWPEATF